MKTKKFFTMILSAIIVITTITIPTVIANEQYVDSDGTVYEYMIHSGNRFSITKVTPGENVDTLNIPGEINSYTLSRLNWDHTYSSQQLSIPQIKTINMPKTVADDFTFTFCNLNTIETVVLPENITSIPDHAFCLCESLKTIVIPESVTYIDGVAFYSCSSLETINIPDSVTLIGDYAFAKCENLVTVNWSKNAQLAYNVFDETKYLKNQPGGMLIIHNGTELYRYGGEDTTVEIPEGVTNIHELAFADTIVEKVVCPTTLTDIGTNAFASAKNLKEIEFKGILNSLGDYAFMNCYSLVEPVFPKESTVIPTKCFAYCKAIKSVIVPEHITFIEGGAFSNCSNLRDLKIEGPTQIRAGAFSNTALKKGTITLNENVTYVPFSEKYMEKTFDADSDPLYYLYADAQALPTSTPTPASKPQQTIKPETTVKPTRTPAPTISPQPTFSPAITPSPTPSPTPTNTINVIKTNGEIQILVNSNLVVFPDSKPFIDENSRTLTPIRAVAQALNFSVNWDNETKTAILIKDGTVITITIGKNIIKRNNEFITMDTTAQVINDRTYIPLRFIGEALEYTVIWK